MVKYLDNHFQLAYVGCGRQPEVGAQPDDDISTSRGRR